MEIPKQIQSLGAQSYMMTPEEKEPYTLTQDEEEKAIRSALVSLKKHKAWKMAMAGHKDGTIAQKIASIDFEKLINRDEILKQANANKNHSEWQKAKLKSEKEEQMKVRDLLKKKCNAKYFYNLMRLNYKKLNKDKPFEQDADNEKLIRTICFFLSRDERIETIYRYTSDQEKSYFDKSKGLLIRGVSGLGKTFLFELVKDNELNPVKIISMIEVSEEIKSEGEYEIDFKNERIIYLDDVGTEEATINHFGTKINWFKDFIEKEYQYKNSFKNIVVSTNLSFQQIEEKYGFRVRSRMKEMFNIVDVNGKDRRK